MLVAFVAGGANPARAQSQTQAESPAAQKYFTDTLLINQDNKTARFYSDLLNDKTGRYQLVLRERASGLHRDVS